VIGTKPFSLQVFAPLCFDAKGGAELRIVTIIYIIRLTNIPGSLQVSLRKQLNCTVSSSLSYLYLSQSYNMARQRSQCNSGKQVNYYKEKKIEEFVIPTTKRKRAASPVETGKKRARTGKNTRARPKAERQE
jgi:hypothetical protein